MKLALVAMVASVCARVCAALQPQTNVGAALAVLATGDDHDPQLVACSAPGGETPCVRLWSPRSKSWSATIAAPLSKGMFGTTLAVLPRPTGGDALLIGSTPHGDGPAALYLAAPPEWTPQLVCEAPKGSKRRFGAALAVFERGGEAQVLVGAPASPGAANTAGAVYVVSLAEKRIVAEWTSPIASASFGAGLVAIADANADGRADVLVASPGEYEVSRGELLLVSSHDGAVLRSFEHDDSRARFTGAVAFVAGDEARKPRVAAVTFERMASSWSLALRLWDFESGKRLSPATTTGEPDCRCGLGTSRVARAALTSIPDVTGDGVDDLLVGFPDAFYALVGHTGSAWIVSGSDGQVTTIVRSEGDERSLGFAVAAARSPAPLAVVGAPDFGLLAGAFHLLALDSPEGFAERITF